MIPRIRGKVGQAYEPEEMKGKWFFELWMSELGKEDDSKSFGQFGPWNTEEEAHKELRKAAQLCCEVFEQKMDGKVSGKYIDMQSNLTRPWDKSDEQ